MKKRNKQNIGLIAISFNCILFLCKYFVGTHYHSQALIADAVNNLTDLLSASLVFVGLVLAHRPADKDHPFGHERYETISGFLMAAIMLLLGLQLLREGIFFPVKETVALKPLVFVVVLISIALKGGLARIYFKGEKATQSPVFLAGYKDSIFDVVISVSMLVSYGLQIVFKWNLDRWFGIGIALIIIVSALDLLRDFLDGLIGKAPSQSLVNHLVSIIEQEPDVKGYHDLMIHTYGRNTKISTVHIEVDADMSLTKAHDIMDRIEKQVKSTLNVDLVIHLDPYDPRLDSIFETIKSTVKEVHGEYTCHDIRFNENTIEFDVVVTEHCPESDEAIIEAIEKRLRHLGYPLQITIDRFEFVKCKSVGGEPHESK